MLHEKTAKDSIKVADVIRSLKEDDLRKEEHSAGDPLTVGAFVAEQDQSGGLRQASKNKSRCFRCKRRGHVVRDCWERKKEEKKEVNHVNSAFDDYCLLMADPKVKPDWLLDSGSSSHICPYREMFLTYRFVADKSIQMGNGDGCKVEGEGDIEFKMADGRGVTLKDVLHIPGQKFGLISLGLLESQGCRYSARGGVLTVWKGRRKLMQGKRLPHQNLYHLSGHVKTWPGCKPNDRGEVLPARDQLQMDPDDRTSSQDIESPDVGGVRTEGGDSVMTPMPSVPPEHSRVC